MSGWGWAAMIFIGWLVVGVVTAPLVGRWLRRVGADYPEPEPQHPPHWDCAPRAPESRSGPST